MKKFTLLFLLAFLVRLGAQAAAPTVTGSNLVYNYIDGTRLGVNLTAGNGSSRIIVMKQGSPVTGLPVDGVDYAANSSFGSANTQFTAPGEYVVSRMSWSDFTVTELQPGTVYYFAIFEFNGSGSNTQYLMLPLTGNRYTAIAPATQASALTSTSATGNTLWLNWTKGNGSGRIVIARKGSPVNADPENLTSYWSNDFGIGSMVGTDNFVVYSGTGNAAFVRNLEPNTAYHFAVFEYNGSSTPVYLLAAPARASFTTLAGPTVAPSSPGFNYIEGSRFLFGVSEGNGTHRLFIARKGAPVTAAPVNGVRYTADAAFGTPGTEIAPGEFVVGATTGTAISLTNLEPNTVYHFRVFEYDMDKANNTYYLTSSFATKSGSTSITPTTVASGLNIISLTGSTATIGFTAGNGGTRMAIMKAGSAVDAAPVDLVRYNGSAYFGGGSQVTPGNYVVVAGMNGSQFNVYNLQPGTTYHLSIYESNGYEYPVYSTAGATLSFTIPLEPTLPSKDAVISSVDGSSFRLIWTSGNGAKRIIIAKKGSPVTARPADYVNYAEHENFGQGDALAPGEFVVYNGSGYYTDISNLDAASTYHFALFEYNVDANGKPDYLIAPYLATAVSTVSAPTVQPLITSVSAVQATQATVNFNKGNGASCIFIMKEGSPVTAAPQDGIRYTHSSAFGSAASLISGGNYAVLITGSGGNFIPSNLKPNTTYHISAFEYNGANYPVYLRTAPATYSFTTGDVPGATVPGVAASNPLVTAADGTRLTLKWTNGNGEKRIVVMRKGTAVNFAPLAATDYAANATFGAGTDLGSGQYIVHNGAANTVDIMGLQPSATYHFAIYEFNGTGDLIRYLAIPLTGTAATATAPATPATNINAVTASGQLVLSWTNGSGTARLVVVKENSPVTSVPSDLGVYPASAVFKSGSQVAAGEYVVYAGNGNTVTVTGLTNGKTYHYSIFEYNGVTGPVYNTAAASGAVAISPALPVTLLYFTAREASGAVKLNWATSQELNNDHFEIERSEDGVRFGSIGRVAGAAGSNATITYSFTDAQPTGNACYRLKQVDRNGQFSYSKIEWVKLTAAAGIRAYPNPARDQFRMELPQGITTATLMVHDAAGALVASRKVSAGQAISSAGWAAGTYYLTLSTAGSQYRTTLLKQ